MAVAPREPDLHVPVLLDEVLINLVHTQSGVYVDGTFGRGGHTRALLGALDSDAQLIGLDRDPEAVAEGQALAAQDPRFRIVHAKFSQLEEVLRDVGEKGVDGVLLDLGVSSPQLDDPRRGFSFRDSGPLDMRMDPGTGISAAQWLNTAEEAEIARAVGEYGEQRGAKRIARAIVKARPLVTTEDLADAVASVIPRRPGGKHPATQTFQAIRIHVNAEDAELTAGLRAAFAVLKPAGRLAVISFHSLEDREVKQTFRRWTQGPQLPRRLPVRNPASTSRAVHIAGPVRASLAETRRNPRARSATLRVIAKVESDG